MPRPQVILSKFRSPDRDPMNRKQVTDTDPVTGLALRARMWYEGNTSTIKVALDALWGAKTLDRNLALRMRQP